MADAGPVPTDERGTSNAERGTSVAPPRNGPAFVAPTEDAVASEASAPFVSDAGPAVDAPPDARRRPTLAEDFAEKLETLKVRYADAEREAYDKPPGNASPETVARVKALAEGIRAQIVADLADMTGEGVVEAATARANHWIDATLARVVDAAFMRSGCAREALIKHFAAETETEIAAAVREIVAMLKEVRDDDLGINSSAVTYECGGYCWGNPAQTGHFRASTTTLCNSLWPTVFEGYRHSPKRYDALALVLFHESLHRTSWWRFKHAAGETYVGTDEYKKLDLKGHIAEADSYAYFAKAVAECNGS